MGPYMSPIPINASMGMLISLAIAFIVTPWLALRLLRRSARTRTRGSRRGAARSACSRALLAPFLDATRGARNRRRLLGGVIGAIAAVASSLAAFKLGRAEDAAVRQQVGVPGGGRHARGHAASRAPPRVLRELGALPRHGARGDRLPGLRGHSRRRSTSTAWCASTTCARRRSWATCRSTCVDKHAARPQEPRDRAGACARRWRRSARSYGANVKVVEVPPGPPVLSPIVAEIYGPDERGPHPRRASRCARRSPRRRTSSASTTRVEDAAPRIRLQGGPEQGGARWASRGATSSRRCAWALAGDDVTPLHDGAVEVRGAGARSRCRPSARASSTSCSSSRCARRDGALVPLVGAGAAASRPSATSTIYHKDLLPVVYVVGRRGRAASTARSTACSPRAASSPARRCEDGGALGEYFIRQPADPYRQYALKWDGEWQVTYETFRDMGLAYAVGPGAHLSAGGGAVPLVPRAARSSWRRSRSPSSA